MTYQKVSGPLMANSHPGSYCGQDAYSDMFVTEGGWQTWSIGNGQLHDAISPSIEVCKTLNCMDDPMKILVIKEEKWKQR